MQEVPSKIDKANSQESRKLILSLHNSVIPDPWLTPHWASLRYLDKLNTSTSVLLLARWMASYKDEWLSNKPVTNTQPT